LEFEGDFVKVGPEEGDLFHRNFKNDVKGYKNSNRALYIEPRRKTLVQNDGFVSGNFYIEPDIAKQTDVKINWTLLSRDFTETGVLIIRIVPKYYVVTKDHSVNDPLEEKEDISYSLIKREGIISIGGPYFNDKESDYTFE
jgi:hypothetical protein